MLRAGQSPPSEGKPSEAKVWRVAWRQSRDTQNPFYGAAGVGYLGYLTIISFPFFFFFGKFGKPIKYERELQRGYILPSKK